MPEMAARTLRLCLPPQKIPRAACLLQEAQVIRRLLAEQLLEPTIPDKPTSRLQQYRLTEKDRTCLTSLRTQAGG